MATKYTYEEVKRIIEENGGQLISTEYKNNTEKLKVLCSNCKKNIFYVSFSNYIHRGRTECPDCVKSNYKPIRWNYDLVKEYVESNGNKLISKKYINVDTIMEFECKKCKKVYSTSFYNYRKLKMYTCKKCSFEEMGKNQAHSYEYVKNYIENMGSELLSDEYRNNNTSLKVKCVICGKIMTTNFAKILQRNELTCKHCSCVKANDDRRFTYEYVKKFVEENSNCKLISTEYKSNRDKLEFECGCEKHNKFKTTFYSFKYNNKRQCDYCSNKIKWDINSVRNFVNKNSTCELLSTEYINIDEKLEFRCECGLKFKTSWDSFKGRKHKRQCNDCSTRSNLERKCKEFFDANGIKYKREKVFKDFINPKTNGYPRYDFYLKQYNLLIECQGVQHKAETNFYGMQTEEEVKRQFKELQYRDELKRKYAEDNNIELLYIWYYELDDIPNILINKLILPSQ